MTRVSPKQITSSHTVGETLQAARMLRKMSLGQVSSQTKIRTEVLTALESGDYTYFASPVYAKGFLRNYTKFLDLDLEKMMALYRRETAAPQPKLKQTTAEKKEIALNKWSQLIYSRKFLIGAVILVVGGLGLFYFANQANALLNPPMLKITAPVELTADFNGDIYVTGNSFQLSGITANRSVVRFNSEILALEADNSFTTPEIPLRDSQLNVVVTSTNQFGRTSTISIAIKKGSPGIAKVDKMSVLVEIKDEVTPLLIRADGKIEFDDRAFPGDIITLEAGSRLQIETPNPQTVQLKINGDTYPVEGVNTTWELIDGKVVKR